MGFDPRITCQMDLDTMRQILDIDDVPQYDLGPVKNIGASTLLSTGGLGSFEGAESFQNPSGKGGILTPKRKRALWSFSQDTGRGIRGLSAGRRAR